MRTIARSLRVAGLFAGIGGIERGLHLAGHETVQLCENDSAARAVLAKHFPGVPSHDDIRTLARLGRVDVVAAGFPCQDLSQVGRTAGIGGRNSSLVREVFRLVSASRRRPSWLLLENVPFMLALDRGHAMRFLVDAVEELGYTWAYRVVDTRAFGLPHRRRRVLFVASRMGDPRTVLLNGNRRHPSASDGRRLRTLGFYWTEGTKGVGLVLDAVPPLKGGSTIGIPSPPAIRLRSGRIVLPDIRDAERLQGFPVDWTKPAEECGRATIRWRLVGNAVSVPVAQWVGNRLCNPGRYYHADDEPVEWGKAWPVAAWGGAGRAYRSNVSMWPVRQRYRHLKEFLKFPSIPLSAAATSGFLARAKASTLRIPEDLLTDLETHLQDMRRRTPRA